VCGAPHALPGQSHPCSGSRALGCARWWHCCWAADVPHTCRLVHCSGVVAQVAARSPLVRRAILPQLRVSRPPPARGGADAHRLPAQLEAVASS